MNYPYQAKIPLGCVHATLSRASEADPWRVEVLPLGLAEDPRQAYNDWVAELKSGASTTFIDDLFRKTLYVEYPDARLEAERTGPAAWKITLHNLFRTIPGEPPAPARLEMNYGPADGNGFVGVLEHYVAIAEGAGAP